MPELDLAVIESRWSKEGNHSVRPIFDTLSGTLTDNPYSYHYEMFNSTESLKELVTRLVEKHPAIHHLYIAAHGDEQSLGIPGGTISRRSSRTCSPGRIQDSCTASSSAPACSGSRWWR